MSLTYEEVFANNEGKTCVVYRGDEQVFSSEMKGVRPLMDYLNEKGPSDEPLIVYDRIMGRGAVMLALAIGAKVLHTPIISETALELAQKYNTRVSYGKTIPYVINRSGDGRCPIESAVLEIDDVKEGLGVIRKTLEQLRQQSLG